MRFYFANHEILVIQTLFLLFKLLGNGQESAFHVMAFCKLGCKPPVHESQGQAIAYELKQSLDSYMLTHYLPSSSRSKVVGKSGSWRGFMEKSPTFILMFLDFLSSSSATLLELGAGTGPLMRAALHTGRRCLVVDNDKDLCDNLLTPFVKSYAHDAGPSIPHVIDDDDTILEFSAPMDW